MATKASLLWLDLEMTGLDPARDKILEVGAIASDWDFNEIARFSGVVHHDEKALKKMLDGNKAFWDANPTARDGLIKQNETGQSSEKVEDAILAFIDKYFDLDNPIYLAGNSIHMDRRFIAAQWPKLDAKLHYRMLDVSSWKIVFENKFKKHFLKSENHRAMDDIEGSMTELKYYLKRIDTKC